MKRKSWNADTYSHIDGKAYGVGDASCQSLRHIGCQMLAPASRWASLSSQSVTHTQAIPHSTTYFFRFLLHILHNFSKHQPTLTFSGVGWRVGYGFPCRIILHHLHSSTEKVAGKCVTPTQRRHILQTSQRDSARLQRASAKQSQRQSMGGRGKQKDASSSQIV